jgi:hypothetical protein
MVFGNRMKTLPELWRKLGDGVKKAA